MGAQPTSSAPAVRPARKTKPKPQQKWPRKCTTKHCRHSVWKHWHSSICPKCATARYRAKFPLHRRYYDLKSRAKQRGHAFTLTRAQFVAWCRSVGYTATGGKDALSPSIDRINESRGYEVGNLQVLTLSQNTRKSYVERRLMAYYGEPVC